MNMDKNELKQVLIEVEKEKRIIARQRLSTAKPIDWRGIALKLWSGRKIIMAVTTLSRPLASLQAMGLSL